MVLQTRQKIRLIFLKDKPFSLWKNMSDPNEKTEIWQKTHINSNSDMKVFEDKLDKRFEHISSKTFPHI